MISFIQQAVVITQICFQVSSVPVQESSDRADRRINKVLKTQDVIHYFLSLSSRSSFCFSRSFTESTDSFRSPSSLRLVRSRSVRIFFSCSRELSICRWETEQTVTNQNRTEHLDIVVHQNFREFTLGCETWLWIISRSFKSFRSSRSPWRTFEGFIRSFQRFFRRFLGFL